MTPPFATPTAMTPGWVAYQPRHAVRDLKPLPDPAIAAPYEQDVADRFIAGSHSVRLHVLALLARFRRGGSW